MSCIESISTRTPGCERASSALRLQPGHPRHRDIQDGEIDLRLAHARDRLGAIGGLGHDPEIGFSVEHQPQTTADHHVVIGNQQPRRERDAHAPACLSLSRTTVPSPRPGLDRQIGADEQRPLAHPAQPGPLHRVREAATVVAHLQRYAAVPALPTRSMRTRGSGVAGDVREALLRDAVDDELLLR